MWLSENLWRWSLPLLLLMFVASLFRAVHSECSSHQFKCANGRCVPISWHCDDDNDCGDNSDEDSCETRTCSDTEFNCANSKCVPNRWICDGEDDCGDKSDEDSKLCQNKTCAPDQFSCITSSGMCIPITWRCDGQEDCTDGSDEKDECHQITCTEEEFTCQNNKCITLRWVCDQDNDCGDGSDEKNCPNVTCSASEFMCSNGKCIPERWHCDGDIDCLDSSDEHGCPKDILPNPCNAREFMCSSRDCIHVSWVCDGDPDCPDRTDEINCTNTCRPDQFQCRSRECILGHLQCNGVKECSDGTDEDNCPSVSHKECDSKTQFDCGGNHCISLSLVCNGKNDCGNWEDEPHEKCNNNECKLNNGGCSQKCVDTPVGYKCECFEGFKLADNKTCEDINECEIPGSCSQLCNNTKGSYKCDCIEGYSLEPSNHHRCKAKEGHTVLLFANRHDIRRINMETLEYTPVVSGLRSTVALDYDHNSQTVIWSDVTEEAIKSAPISTGSPVTTIISEKISTPDGIAVDWIYGHIYWTDTGKNTIELSDMTGKMRKVLIGKDLDEPRAIVLNPMDGWMFWTDWGEPAKIERAGMDGSHRSTVVSSDIRWPNGLAIDFISRKIYWADAKLHILASADYDGENQRVILSSNAVVKHPFSLDVFEDWLYWTDWESEAIHRVNKFTGEELNNVAVGIFSPMDVHVYHGYKQPKGQNYCGNLNGFCSHMCLPAPKLTGFSAKYTCACPDDMSLSTDQKTCIADATTTTTTTTTLTPEPTTVKQTTAPAISSSTFPIILNRPTTTNSVPSMMTSKIVTKNSVPTTSTMSSQSSSSQAALVSTSMTASEVTTSFVKDFPATTVIPHAIAANETVFGSILEEVEDNGRIAGIIIGVLGGLAIVFAVVGICLYKQYLRRNVTSMNFDNPVYRKTTEDQFSLEKNQYQPARSYPPSLEPLTSPGTNEFV